MTRAALTAPQRADLIIAMWGWQAMPCPNNDGTVALLCPNCRGRAWIDHAGLGRCAAYNPWQFIKPCGWQVDLHDVARAALVDCDLRARLTAATRHRQQGGFA